MLLIFKYICDVIFSSSSYPQNLELDFEAQSQKLHKLELEMVELASIGKDDKEVGDDDDDDKEVDDDDDGFNPWFCSSRH